MGRFSKGGVGGRPSESESESECECECESESESDSQSHRRRAVDVGGGPGRLGGGPGRLGGGPGRLGGGPGRLRGGPGSDAGAGGSGSVLGGGSEPTADATDTFFFGAICIVFSREPEPNALLARLNTPFAADCCAARAAAAAASADILVVAAAAAAIASLFICLDAERRRTRLARFCLIFSRIVPPLLIITPGAEDSPDPSRLSTAAPDAP